MIGYFRNVAANDEVKCKLCQPSKKKNCDHDDNICEDDDDENSFCIVREVQMAMNRYLGNSTLQEHAIGLIGSIALRQPMNCLTLIRDYQIHIPIVMALQKHSEKVPLQRQGALTIRNLVARTPELIIIVLGQDSNYPPCETEYTLRYISGKHLHCQDEVYAALRDLHLSTSAVYITQYYNHDNDTTTPSSTDPVTKDDTNHNNNDTMNSNTIVTKVQSNRMMFGETNNTNFRPVF